MVIMCFLLIWQRGQIYLRGIFICVMLALLDGRFFEKERKLVTEF